MIRALYGSTWSTLAVVNAFVLGVYVAFLLSYFLWRFRKKVVRRDFWDRLVNGYVSLERSHQRLTMTHSDSAHEYQAMLDRVQRTQQENQLLQRRMQKLESHLDEVTNEATTLVTGLKHNERRWADAEQDRQRLQTALQEALAERAEAFRGRKLLENVNAELARRLDQAQVDLETVGRQLVQTKNELQDRTTLEAQLNDAIEQNRLRSRKFGQLEHRYRATHQQLVAVITRNELLEAQLEDESQREDNLLGRPAAPVSGPSLGAFDLPVPSGPHESRTQLAPAQSDKVIDLRPDSSPADHDHRPRRRGRRRFSRSYGTLPD